MNGFLRDECIAVGRAVPSAPRAATDTPPIPAARGRTSSRKFAARVLAIPTALLLIAAAPATAIDLLAGKTAAFKDHPAGADRDEATVKFLADPNIVRPLPDPTTSTSSIELRTDTRAAGPVVLAPSRWKAVGKGFVYRDPAAAAGGVQKVVLRPEKPGGMLLIHLAGAAYGADPVTAPLSFVEVSLTVGGTQYCGRFGSPPSRLEVRAKWVRFTGPSTACAAILPPTATVTSTGTPTATATPPSTGTATVTATASATPPSTATATPTPTDTPTATPTPTSCPAGYQLQDGACVDIDECAVCPGAYGAYPACPCGKFGACTNTPGSYSCAFSPPLVTSVSPFFVTLESAAHMTIVGVGLGLDQDDLVSITVGNIECVAPIHHGGADSETMVTCNMGIGTPIDADPSALVVVTTKSAGAGTCVPTPPFGCAVIFECFPEDRDCHMVCNGDAKLDPCGVCEGDGSSCL